MNSKNECYPVTVKELCRMTGREIADELKRRQGDPSEAEYRSWGVSIPILAKVLHQAGLDELTLILEYQTPTGSRIDAVLVGERRGDHRPLVLIIELKQWSAIEENNCGLESVVTVSILHEERLHPVQQTLTYAKHLRRNHSSVENGGMEVQCCQFLHNFEDKEQLFQGNYQAYAPLRHETYGKGEDEKLAEDLRKLFAEKPRPDLVESFLSGTYVLGKVGMEDLRRALAREENAVMLDDQIEVNRVVCRQLDSLRDRNAPLLVVISGPPGTGKTVVGLHILYAYCKKYGSTGRNNGGGIFAMPRSRTLKEVIEGASGVSPVYLDAVPPGRDLVVVDEAHRIENLDATMDSLFRKARMVVVLQDDHQRIRLTEEGTRENFQRFAQARGIELISCSLASQKRAGYLGSYVSDLDQLLYQECDEPIQRQSELELRCWDSLLELDQHLHSLWLQDRHVKWYAPFCWPWSRTTGRRDIVIREGDDVFEKAWNPVGGQYSWYVGQAEGDLDQVGCIYTAQGLEFDDTGVIWWDDLRWDEQARQWRVDLSRCRDTQFMSSINHGRADQDAVKELVLNTYRVLLTRAKSSVHIWFKDPVTKEHVRKVLGI